MINSLEKFEEIAKILERDVPSTQEVADLVAQIIEVVRQAKEFLEKQAIDNKKDLNSFVNRLTEQEVIKISEALDNLEKKAEKVVKSIKEKTALDLDSITRNLYKELKKLEDSIPQKADFTEVYGKIKEVESKIVPVKEVSGEKIVDKINELPIEPEFQIEKEHIKGLEDELKAIRSGPRGGGGASRGVFQPKLDRFKDDCNGSNKTFYLSREPLATDTIEVSGTDFPIILDPTVDFTVSGKTLTLTSAVPAPSLGATLICKYYA